jgi:NTP pyrophosphatase (non-canonical NTP hydrolase)
MQAEPIASLQVQQFIEDIISITDNYIQTYNLEFTQDDYVQKVQDEMGEFVHQFVKYKQKGNPSKYISPEYHKEQMATELADMIGAAFALAKSLDLNLLTTFETKRYPYLPKK